MTRHIIRRETHTTEAEKKQHLFDQLESVVNTYRANKTEGVKSSCVIAMNSVLTTHGHSIPDVNLGSTFDELVRIYSKLASARTRVRNGTSKKAIPFGEFHARVHNLLFGQKYTWR